jgi:hypothetical protein
MSDAPRRRLHALAETFAVCRFSPDEPPPAWLFHGEANFYSITRTSEELSVVCCEDDLPPSVERCERGWRALALEGPIPFTTTGVLAALVTPLAAAGIPVFAISTFDTDLLLVKAGDFDRTLAALRTTFDFGETKPARG